VASLQVADDGAVVVPVAASGVDVVGVVVTTGATFVDAVVSMRASLKIVVGSTVE